MKILISFVSSFEILQDISILFLQNDMVFFLLYVFKKKKDNWKSKSVHINYKFWLLMSNSQNFVKDISIRTMFFSSILYHRDQHDERRERSKFLILVKRLRSTFFYCIADHNFCKNKMCCFFVFFFLLNASQNFRLKIYVTANMELNTFIP